MCYGIIYTIENKVNGKIYVGQTTKSFNERYGGDIRNTHNKHLKRSIEKHNIENFEIDKCLCECDSEEELNEAEKFYIDFFDAMNREHGYNKKDGGNNGLLSEETKEKISQKTKEAMANPEVRKKHKEALANPEVRKKHKEAMANPEIREKKSQNMKRLWQNPEVREKISQRTKEALADPEVRKKHKEAVTGSKNPRARAIVQLDKKGNFIREFSCISDARRQGIRGDISACCRGKHNFAGGYVWMYEEDYIDLIKYSF